MAKDAGACQLRKAGFIVHEKVDATDEVDNLGYRISGNLARVTPSSKKFN